MRKDSDEWQDVFEINGNYYTVEYGIIGDEVIVVSPVDFGRKEYIVKHRVCGNYLTVYGTFSYEKALQKAEQINPHF